MAWLERYVRNDAAGSGDGTTNANSGPNGAYTWNEMKADTTSGSVRYNIPKAFGDFTRTTTADTFTTAGTTAAPRSIRGFNSSIGDLEGNGRTAGGALITTNFPVITYTTGSLTIPTFFILEHLSVVSAKTAATLTASGSCILRRSAVSNTHASSSTAVGVDLSTAGNICDDCDITVASTNAAALCMIIAASKISRCLLTAPNGGYLLNPLARSVIQSNMLMNAAKGIVLSGTGAWATIESNSFRNISGLYIDNQLGMAMIQNNVAWGTGGSSQWYNSTTSVRTVFQDTNAVGNMGASDVNQGEWPLINVIALSADPYVSSSDLQLNATSGGGADCKSVGRQPYLDLGAWQAVGGTDNYALGVAVGQQLARAIG